MRILVLALLAISAFSRQHSFAQSVSTSVSAPHENARSREILASFNKTKHEVREKLGIRKEKYKDIHSEPVIRPSLQDYVGTYRVPDLGCAIDIARTGTGVTITGTEPQDVSPAARRFHLEGTTLDGALLAGTKVYDDGERTQFEGLFINMTDSEGISPTEVSHRATTFGLGVVGVQLNRQELYRDKLFYHFER
jgi:hypothetical protein